MNGLDLYIQRSILGPNELKSQIVQFVKTLDIDDVGFADTELYGRIDGSYTLNKILLGVKSAIVYVSLLKKVLNKYGQWYVVSLVKHISKPSKQVLCTDCGICVNACPIGATGEKIDQWRYKNRRKRLKKGCGIPCVELCPIGQS